MQQRNGFALVALGCAVALLLPLLALVDDDVVNDLGAFVPVEAVVLTAPVAVAAVTAQSHSLARFTLAALADTRSPPRA